MLVPYIVQLVDLSRKRAKSITLIALGASLLMGLYVSTHFSINTDVNKLLSPNLAWRQREAEFEKAFPQKTDVLLVVIDSTSSDAVEDAAVRLTEKLRALPERFTFVERPDATPFFRKNGLLFLPQTDLTKVLNEIVQAQPLLGALAADPSLRGLFGTIGLMAQGFAHGAVSYNDLERPFSTIADTVQNAEAGNDMPIGWARIISDAPPAPRELRRLIITKPVLDYGDLEPGRKASAVIRQLAQELDLTAIHGVSVRLTGSVALNDDQFASVASGTGNATFLSAVLVIILLWLALHSLRLIVPILLTLTAGLIATTAVALLVVGSLNLISVAFAVMFIGIAVDFGIQFGVRYRDQHFKEPNHAKAMVKTAQVIAVPLTMAAASTSLGFLSFMPTEYRGVSELGFIAGIGMLIAFGLSITLFPALVSLLRPPPEREPIGFKWAASLDEIIIAQRRNIMILALIATIAGGALATKVRFDFDPLDLMDPRAPSVSTLYDLMRSPDFSTYTIDILRPPLVETDNVADALRQLPEVDHVMTLASFVPDDQHNKLLAIADTRTLLQATLNPPNVQAPPTDQEILDSLNQAAISLHAIGKGHDSAERLAKALDAAVARRDPGLLRRLHNDLVRGMVERLDSVRECLKAESVTLDSISDDVRRDWITPDGQALIQVYPKGNMHDQNKLSAFVDAVQRLAPDASGSAVSIRESGKTVTSAFIHAGCYALVTIMLMAFLVLRRTKDVLVLIAPLILAGILTLATIVAIGLPLNFANIIALPLLLSLGVSYAIYFVSYWRAGLDDPLQSSMARAVLFSAATALVAFGTLGLSSYPGTSGMGKLLTVALLYSLTCTFFILPALLGRHKADRHSRE